MKHMERAPPPTKRPRDDAAAAPKKKKRRKTKRKKAADSWTQPTARHAFAVSPSDHAETPVTAYEDLAPFLRAVGGRVYDPYYCDGGVRRRLAALGFREVFNENRDFYADIQSKSVPRHDVLVTNPPYSGDLCGNQISDAPRHRPDVPVTASARWRGDSTPSTRRSPPSCGSSMAWRFTKVSDDLTHWLISTQAATTSTA